MPSKNRVILTCTECLSRNYSVYKNKKTATKRLELMKYCKRCGKHTLHKETKQEDIYEVVQLKWDRQRDQEDQMA